MRRLTIYHSTPLYSFVCRLRWSKLPLHYDATGTAAAMLKQLIEMGAEYEDQRESPMTLDSPFLKYHIHSILPLLERTDAGLYDCK